MQHFRRLITAGTSGCLLLASSALAQPAALGVKSTSPIDIEATALEVDQPTGQATFTGNVKVTQANLELTAQQLVVSYASKGSNDINTITATGNVTLVRTNPGVTEQATGAQAVYSPSAQLLTLTGPKVVLTRGPSSLTGDKLVFNLTTGAARVTQSNGQVQARFVPTSK